MFEAIGAAFVAVILLGPLWWLAFLCVIGVSIFFAENEMPGTAAFFAAIIIGALWWFGIANVPLWVWNNPWTSLLYLAGYIGIGVAWAFYKFDRFGFDEALRYEKDKAANPGFKKKRVEHETKKDNWGNPAVVEVDDPTKPAVDIEEYKPLAINNKYKLTNWIVIWWGSMLWWVFHDMIHRMVDFVIRHFGHLYDKVAARHFERFTTT